MQLSHLYRDIWWTICYCAVEYGKGVEKPVEGTYAVNQKGKQCADFEL